MALTFFVLLYTGEGIYLYIVAFQFLILCLSAINIVATFALLRLHQSLEPAEAVRGDSTVLKIEVHNESVIPFAHLSLRYHTVESRFSGKVRRFNVYIPPRGNGTAEIPVYCPYRGQYGVGLESAVATDIFGLFRFKLKGEYLSQKQAQLLVYPRLRELSRGALPNREDEGATISSRSRAEEISSIAEIRDFRDGDPLKRVHWKLSARMGELMIKEFEGSLTSENVVMLDCTDHGLAGENAARLEDTMTEAAAAFCKRFCDDFRPLTLVSYTDERTETVGTEPADFPAFYTSLARQRFGGALPMDGALRLELDERVEIGSLVLITKTPSDELFELLCALAASDCLITLVIAMKDTEYDDRSVRMMGEFAMRGIRAITLLPGEDVTMRLVGEGGGI